VDEYEASGASWVVRLGASRLTNALVLAVRTDEDARAAMLVRNLDG
jgi:hypothetical protein